MILTNSATLIAQHTLITIIVIKLCTFHFNDASFILPDYVLLNTIWLVYFPSCVIVQCHQNIVKMCLIITRKKV